MSRVDEIQKNYPTIPRDMIISWDIRRYGIRYTEVVDKVSHYTRAGGLYQSRDNDVTLKDIAAQKPGAMRPGFVLRAPRLYMKSGFGARVIRDTRSPYEIREEGPNQYAIYEQEERIEDAYFPNPKHWSEEPEKEPRTSKGTPVTSLITLNRRCFGVTPVRHCQYFDTGDQCRFCNFNATQIDASATGARAPVTSNLEETVEAYKIITSQMPPFVEGRLVMGGFTQSENEAKVHHQFVEKILSATSYRPAFTPAIEPMSRENMQRLKDAGASAVTMNIEVWHPRLFEEVCPGKHKFHGRDRWLEAYHEAVDVFGWGHVGTNMPGCVTLMPENGHQTWQEARDSQIEGIRWFVEHGVFPFFEPLVLGVGSVYGDNPANRQKLAPTEYYLDLALAHHEACKEYDMYDRMDKFMWCMLDCPSSGYAGELGMIEVAGDIGKWAGTVVAEDANWIGRFIESFKAKAKTL